MIYLVLKLVEILFLFCLMHLWSTAFPSVQFERIVNKPRFIFLSLLSFFILTFAQFYLVTLFLQTLSVFLIMLILLLRYASLDFKMFIFVFIFCVFFICGKTAGIFILHMSADDNGIYFLGGPYGFIPTFASHITILTLSWLSYRAFKGCERLTKIPTKTFVLLLLLPLSSLCLFFGLSGNTLYSKSAIIMGIIGLATSNILVLLYFEKNAVIEDQRAKTAFLEAQINLQRKHYTELEENNTDILKMRHDLKNTILALSGYAEADDLPAIKAYLESTVPVLSDLDRRCMVYTGYSAIDSILSEKKRIAKKQNTSFKIKCRLAKNIFWVDEMDLCILLSNGLDNALEACAKLGSNKKIIHLTLELSDKSFKMTVKNTWFTRIIPKASLTLKTTKQDKKYHGFGLPTIREISKKYNGLTETSVDENWFCLTVFLFH